MFVLLICFLCDSFIVICYSFLVIYILLSFLLSFPCHMFSLILPVIFSVILSLASVLCYPFGYPLCYSFFVTCFLLSFLLLFPCLLFPLLSFPSLLLSVSLLSLLLILIFPFSFLLMSCFPLQFLDISLPLSSYPMFVSLCCILCYPFLVFTSLLIFLSCFYASTSPALPFSPAFLSPPYTYSF